ncbi:MAG: adenylyl-sulfate kinase [Oscillospiraceae bacterium]
MKPAVRRTYGVRRIWRNCSIPTAFTQSSPWFLQQRRHAKRAYTTIGRHRCREIHVSTPFAACEQRDTKGFYAHARANQLAQMTGVRAAYEQPAAPLMPIDTSEMDVLQAVSRMLEAPKVTSSRHFS